ncbi:MAG: hypothetical protein LDL41_26355 [Coleofasciculus sp. S288]|nr:hypothetical protein [Coleofasciculus sp. S288]
MLGWIETQLITINDPIRGRWELQTRSLPSLLAKRFAHNSQPRSWGAKICRTHPLTITTCHPANFGKLRRRLLW